MQYMIDNVDHNTTTNGFGTFHGMGMLAAITPNYKFGKVIPRRLVSKEQVTSLAKINIQYCANENIKELIYEPLNNVVASDKTYAFEQLYNIVGPLKSPIYGWVNANYQQRCLSGQIIIPNPSHDRYGPDKSFVHIFYLKIYIDRSKQSRTYSNSDI